MNESGKIYIYSRALTNFNGVFEIPKFDKRSSRQKEVFQVQSYIMCINQHDLILFSQPSFDKK